MVHALKPSNNAQTRAFIGGVYIYDANAGYLRSHLKLATQRLGSSLYR